MALEVRKTNEAGLGLIKKAEGLHLEAYLCPAKIWTIGYGHTRGVSSGMRITEEQADKFLSDDLYVSERAVSRLVSVPLNDNQFSALVSFVFNVGAGNFAGSTLLKLLNRGLYDQVPAQLMRWTKANGETLGGLSIRRAAEGALFNARC